MLSWTLGSVVVSILQDDEPVFPICSLTLVSLHQCFSNHSSFPASLSFWTSLSFSCRSIKPESCRTITEGANDARQSECELSRLFKFLLRLYDAEWLYMQLHIFSHKSSPYNLSHDRFLRNWLKFKLHSCCGWEDFALNSEQCIEFQPFLTQTIRKIQKTWKKKKYK